VSAASAEGGQDALGTHLAFVPVGLVQSRRPLEPTAGIGGHRHQGGHPDTDIEGIEEDRTIAIEAVRHNRLERQTALATDDPQHLHGQLRFALKRHVIGHVALGTSLCIVVAEPRLGKEESFLHQRIAMT
jgi:hypothetical protein